MMRGLVSLVAACLLSLTAGSGPAAAQEEKQEEEQQQVDGSEKAVEDVPLPIDAEATGLKEAPPAPKPDEDVAHSWNLRWEHGIHYELTQKILFPGHEYFPWRHEDYRKLEGRMGFKIHVDAAAFREQGDIPDIPADVELRRGRIYTQGNTFFFSPLDFTVEFGFAGSDFFFSEGYLRWNDVKYLSTVQAGQFKAPMSLEMMGSSGITVLMERGSPVLAFAPGSRLGLQIGGPFLDERMTLTAGTYANVADLDVGDATESAAGPMGRFTWAPAKPEDEGSSILLHLGVSASYIDSRDNAFQYRSRPECFIAPFLVDTGEMSGEYATIYGLETAAVRGPLTVQAEYLQSLVDRHDTSDVKFKGAYGYLSYFITGETRRYNSNKGILGRIHPTEPFSHRGRQWGAWEVAGRASYLDLSDNDVRGGRMRNLSAAINWYWNRDDRVMFNYVYSNVDDTPESGRLHILQVRVQFEY